MSGVSKVTAERNQKLLLELIAKPGNDICADCKARSPRWASHNLGIFICMNCASIHRKIGTHISKVKSVTMDTWTKEQVESMKAMGNVKSNALHNPNEIRHPLPANFMDSERDSELEQYIRSKYEFKRFVDKSSLVASKLGPSRSASSITSSASSRSVSTPLAGATSATSNVSITRPSTQMEVPKRPHTSANTGPPIRAVSQPLATPQQSQPPPPPPNAATAPEGVWADLVSLQTPPSSSSLPLQYQVTPQQPSFIGGVTTFQTGMSVNPFQQQQAASNPFFQQQFISSPGIAQTSFTGLHQPYLTNQAQPPISAPIQMQPPFFQPRPQQGNLQIQLPTGGQPSFASPITPGAFTSAPASQGQFLSSSPAMQYSSYSPQAQPPMMSSTPQVQMQMHQPGQFVSHSPHLFMTGSPHPTTPQPQMQMQHGSFVATTPQTGQFAGFQGQGQGPGGFTGQQWSAL